MPCESEFICVSSSRVFFIRFATYCIIVYIDIKSRDKVVACVYHSFVRIIIFLILFDYKNIERDLLNNCKITKIYVSKRLKILL